MGEDLLYLAQVFSKDVRIHFSERKVYMYSKGHQDQLTSSRNASIVLEQLNEISESLRVLDVSRIQDALSFQMLACLKLRIDVTILKYSPGIRLRLKEVRNLCNTFYFRTFGTWGFITILAEIATSKRQLKNG